MPSLPLRIAILEADTPLPNTKKQYGGYGGVFEALLKRGARALSQQSVNGGRGLDPDRDLRISKCHVEGDDVSSLFLLLLGIIGSASVGWVGWFTQFVKVSEG